MLKVCYNLMLGAGYISLFPPESKKIYFEPISDTEALKSDFQNIGDDLRRAMNKVHKQEKIQLNEIKKKPEKEKK